MPSLRLGAIAAFLAAVALPSAAAAQALSYERIRHALENVHQFSQVAVSPDGRRFISVEGDDVLLGDVANPGGRRRLAAGGDAQWSPDGTRIAYVATDAKGQGQIAVADVAMRRSHTVTRARGPIQSPKWSPDGRSIAFLYAVGAPKRPSPLNPATRDAGVVGGTPVIQRLAVVPAAGGATRVLGPVGLNVYEYDWSPDGRRFALTAATGDGDANWWVAELYVGDAARGTMTKIHHPPLQIASPRWSPDGAHIAYIGGIMSDEAITGGDLYTVPAAGGDAVDVTPNLAGSVYAFSWSDAKRIYASELRGGATALASVDVDAKVERVLWQRELTHYASGFAGIAPGDLGVSISRDGRVSATILQGWNVPPEIAFGPPGAWKPATESNAATAKLTGPARSITWTSDDFHPQGWLVLPSDYVAGKTLSLITVIHGGPAFAQYPLFPSGAENFIAYYTARGYAVFAPNPRGSYGQGEAFTKANVKDFGYGDLRDILTGLDAVEKTVSVDPKRVGIMGWSYGGYMTMWSVTQTDRFKAAVSGAGLSNWQSYYGTNDIDTWMIPYFGASVYDDPQVYAKSSPITFIKNVKTPTLLVAGDSDAEVPVTQSYEYHHALRDLGVPTQFVVYPGEGHLFNKPADQTDVVRRAVAWFERWFR